MAEHVAATAEPSRANLALGLAITGVVVWIALIATDHDGPLWLLQPVLGAAAAITGWRAGGGGAPRGRALVAVVVGGLLFAMFAAFIIAEIAS